jgi:hypothetical protein
MVNKTINNLTTEVYHQSIPFVVVIVTIASVVASYVNYSNYSETGSAFHLILANVFLLVAIIFLKPVIEWRRVAIDDDCLTIYKLFFKPIRINISQSLYQVTMNNDDIRSYRFRAGKHYTQISPEIYKNGNRLSKRLKDHIAQKKLIVEVMN